MVFRGTRGTSSACMHLCPKVPRIWEKEASGWPIKTIFLITGHCDMQAHPEKASALYRRSPDFPSWKLRSPRW